MSRAYLAPLSAVYGAAVATKNLAYKNRLFTAKLSWPVVSIGNLSVGGSGKTPLTIRLAELLTAEGIAVDVLSRGYGRTSTATEQVDPSGDAGRFGDEPLLIARRANVPGCNNGGANAISVAEHSLMLMLAVARKVIWQHGNVAAGRWRGNAPKWRGTCWTAPGRWPPPRICSSSTSGGGSPRNGASRSSGGHHGTPTAA